jgi:hypothetical protein
MGFADLVRDMSGLACGDKLKPVLVWSPLSILLGWEKTIWQNLERIVIIG